VTDRNGAAQLTTGLGDLLVWASKEGKFAYDKLDVSNMDTLRLVLSKTSEANKTINYDLIPPKVFKPVLAADGKDKKINDHRLAAEDSIRNHYMSTFKDSAWIRSFAKNHGMAEDTLLRVLRLSYGNWKEMVAYIENNQASARKLLFPLTYGISDKDLSDTKASILTDHLVQAIATAKPEELNSEFYEKYVLAPRVDLELLSPWRSFLWKYLGAEVIADTRQDINVLTNWVRTNIRIDRDANKHSRAPLMPIGVYNLRVADPLSRDIFFVAACRTFGIPARLNPETHVPEYNKSGTWYRAGFEAVAAQPEMGKLSLKDRNNSLSPQYTLHFTIARIQDGICKTLDFDEGKKLTDFPDTILLETGHYILVTGKRLTDGSVLSSVTFFEITKENPATIDITLRKEGTTVKSVGQLEPMKIHLTGLSNNRKLTLSELMEKNSSIIILLDPDSEPSKHILNDLAPYIEQFNQWNGRFIFVNISEKAAKSAIFQTYKLPSKIAFAVDTKNELRKEMTNLTVMGSTSNLPVVVFCQPSGEVLMVYTGYKIGVGEQLLQLIKRLEEGCVPASQARCAAP
jgi:hypothetical protein